MNKTVIIPAILPENEYELADKLGLIANLSKEVHVDVCDGLFTPEKSWPYAEREDWQKFLSITKQEEGLPHWRDFDFEVHLMIRKPEEVLERWFAAGVSKLIIHAEAAEPQAVENMAKFLDGRAELGLGVNLETPTSAIEKYAASINYVHLMSISEIGYQGSEFSEEIFDKIKEVKKNWPDLPISVDGGINEENIKELQKVGAERFVVGSAIFADGAVKENYKNLSDLIN